MRGWMMVKMREWRLRGWWSEAWRMRGVARMMSVVAWRDGGWWMED